MNQVDYCCILLGIYLLWQSFLHVVGREEKMRNINISLSTKTREKINKI